jgi:metal-dependent amidase/aminoacylase/carboxypeptidase family protein
MLAIDSSMLKKLIDAELPELIEIRHRLHRNPGTNFEEHFASETVKRELERVAIPFRGGLARGTGVVGHLAGRAPSAIGLRADMDALPIKEENTFEYASERPGFMHACGHDGHTTILLGVARVLAKVAKTTPLPRPVTFIFQPAEEGGGGGKLMIEDGCLDGSLFAPPVEQMFALHGWPDLPLGEIATRVGPVMAATHSFEIRLTGQGGHAAFPQFVRDPLIAAAAIITAAQSIVSRNVDPLEAAVISFTQCCDGTTFKTLHSPAALRDILERGEPTPTFNVIGDVAMLRGTMRALKMEVGELLAKRLAEVVRQVAAAHQCAVEITYPLMSYPVTTNAAEAVKVLQSVLPGPVHDFTPVMGGEDFAYYSQKVPSAFFALGLRPGAERIPGLHHPRFDFNDGAIRAGMEAFCRLALRTAD